MNTTSKRDLAALMAEFDAERVTQSERRHAAFRSAQQRVDRARGISRAAKVGLILAVAVVLIAVVL